MVENIKNEFKNIIKQSDWMDDESKKSAKIKADLIESFISHPDYIYNDTYLNEIYKDYIFNENSYLNNSIKLFNLKSKQIFSVLGKQINRKE